MRDGTPLEGAAAEFARNEWNDPNASPHCQYQSDIERVFKAGASWQREQDAKLAEEYAESNGPTANRRMGGYAVARRIREQS